MNVTVIGLGAMGGGIARALLRSNEINTVTGYDLSYDLTRKFREEASAIGKSDGDEIEVCDTTYPLNQAITQKIDAVVVALVNESQCNQICFGDTGGTDSSMNLKSLLRSGSCVIVCSTVSASWCRSAHAQFSKINIKFVDCPMSGGPIRALKGELTLMAAGEEDDLAFAKPILAATGKEIHIIPGGPGMGSTVKMVHQLLAGVHIVVAAEALALAAKAGLDVKQMYDIVNGAAGASWMFRDRGQRMIDNDDERVMSALSIFIKDMDIVYSEAKRLKSPIPVAAAALQQFIAGASLGCGSEDDSHVIRVYEKLSGVTVQKPVKTKEDHVPGSIWRFEDGTEEQILEVGQEPRHATILSNEYTRVLKVSMCSKDTTCAHRHEEDSLYFFLVPNGLSVINHVKGSQPKCDCMEFGEVRYGTHRSQNPLVHKITNMSNTDMLCIDAEVLKSPPIISPIPLVAMHHLLIKVRDKCRVYRLTLEPGESVSVSYLFFHLTVVLCGGKIKTEIGSDKHSMSWESDMTIGDIEWKTPSVGLKITNTGQTVFEQYIAEWC